MHAREFARWRRRWAVFATGSFALLASLRGDVTLAPLFQDGAVLQSGQPITVWGSATPGEKVTVALAGQTRTATAAPDGRWVAILDQLPSSRTPLELVARGAKSSAVARDVLVGEVWLCSGQSNMEFNVKDALNGADEVASARYPLIRHIRIERTAAAQPAHAVATSGWRMATPEHVPYFTAVGYFFARDIHQRLGVPVGIVHSSWGGTRIQSWMSPMALSDPSLATALSRYAAEEGASRPGSLFNGMINPLLPYGLRGILWYQGESNTDRPDEYHALFSALITTWRSHFGQGDLPFFWVNLANFRANDPSDRGFALLREAQTKTLMLPNTGEAITVDIGEAGDIHPRNKQEVARRLALLAKRRVYEITTHDTGPTFAAAEREGATLRVRFVNESGALIARDKPPQALEIAGADRVFRPAVGRIDRGTLLVSSPEVKEPVAVRYAFRNAPDANLYGGNGLPVVPFRSDSW